MRIRIGIISWIVFCVIDFIISLNTHPKLQDNIWGNLVLLFSFFMSNRPEHRYSLGAWSSSELWRAPGKPATWLPSEIAVESYINMNSWKNVWLNLLSLSPTMSIFFCGMQVIPSILSFYKSILTNLNWATSNHFNYWFSADRLATTICKLLKHF